MTSEKGVEFHERLRTISLVVLASLAVCYILHLVGGILIPFVVAVFLCYMFSPLIKILEKRKVAKWLIIVVIFVILGLLIFGTAQLVFTSVSEFQQDATIFEKIKENAIKWGTYFGLEKERIVKSINLVETDWKRLLDSDQLKSMVGTGLGSFFGFTGGMLTTLLFLGFMLGGQKALAERVERFVFESMEDKESAKGIISRINQGIRQFLYLKVVISIGTGLVIGIVLSIFGVKFAWLWAAFSFLLNFIPSIGPIIATIPPALMAFIMFENPLSALVVTVIIAVIQFVSGNIVEPKFMGKTLNLNTIVILISLMFWGMIWGIPGMLLSMPMTAILNVIFREIPYFKTVSILMSENDL